ncbi:MAG: aldehyde dehydrogenase family protein [Acidobacteriota bacterium]
MAEAKKSFDIPKFKEQYENYIGGEWAAPKSGEYFDVTSPVDGKSFTKVARSQEADVEAAIDAAHAAFDTWGKTSATERSNILLKIADRMEQNLELLARAETWDNGVVGQIIPWNFPLLMATWKMAPALAAGNCIVLKPAEQTPASILVWAELIGDLLPKGVLNIVNGFGVEAGKPLATSSRIAKVAFTGETTTGRLIMQYASQNLIPVTLELGGKSPNVFFESVMDADDEFFDKCLEGATLFALNQGEVCTCPSRVLVQESIAERFIPRFVERTKKIKMGHPLDPTTMMGAQASKDQYEKILNYLQIAKDEGAEVLTGGNAYKNPDLEDGYYIEPTIVKGHNKMRVFQEEIFGPVVALTTFKDETEAIEIANDTLYGLGAGVWTRDAHELYRVPRAIQAGRVWVNNYHNYPAHAPFGGYKESGFGRENHLMMLDHYRQTKNMLISYDKKAMGFF